MAYDDDNEALEDQYDDEGSEFEDEPSDTSPSSKRKYLGAIALAGLVVFILAGVAAYVAMNRATAARDRARAQALRSSDEGSAATGTVAPENKPPKTGRRAGAERRTTRTKKAATTSSSTITTASRTEKETTTAVQKSIGELNDSDDAQTEEDESDAYPATKPPLIRETSTTTEAEETTLYEAVEVPTPLMCVTGRMKTSPVLPEDGLCDYLIFSAVSIGMKSGKNPSNATVIERPVGSAESYKEFKSRAKGAKSTKYAVSLEGDFLIHGEKYVHMYPKEIFIPFIDNNIKGFGIAYLDTDITTYLERHQSRIEYTITRMDVVVKKFDKEAYSFFIIASLAPKGEDRSTFANQLYDTVHEYPTVFVSHLTNTKAKPCRVLPSSFWKYEDTNNSYIASIKDALRMKRVINRYDMLHVVSLTAAVFSFTITKKTANNMNGWTNIKCERCQVLSMNDVCKGGNFTRGTKGAELGIHYDYRKADRTWRTYETEKSISKKLQLAFSHMRAHGNMGTGVAMFDIDADEASKCGSTRRFQRVRHLRKVMLQLKTLNQERSKPAAA